MGSYYDELRYTPRDPDASKNYRTPVEGESLKSLPDVFKEALSPFAIKRMWDRRSSQYEGGTPLNIDEDVQAELNAHYNLKEEKYLKESNSMEEFVARKKNIQDDRRRTAAAGDNILAYMAFQLFDPFGIGLGLISGGLGIGAKSAGIAKALKIGAASGIENAALETILMNGNTQSDATDILAAAAAGAVIGGALSPLMRTAKPEIAREADAVDASLRVDTERMAAGEVFSQVADTAPRTELDMRLIRAGIADHEASLAADANAPITRSQASKMQQEIQELHQLNAVEQQNINIIRGEHLAEQDAIQAQKVDFVKAASAEREAVHNAYAARIAEAEDRIKTIEQGKQGKNTPKKLWEAQENLRSLEDARTREIAAVEARMNRKVKAAEARFKYKVDTATHLNQRRQVAIESQIKDRQERISRGLRSEASKKELERWKKLSEEEKIKELYGKDVPVRKVELEAQAKVREPITSQATPESLTRETNQGIAVGAARAGEIENPTYTFQYDIPSSYEEAWMRFAQDGCNIPEDLIGVQYLGSSEFSKMTYSPATQLMNSKNYAVRGLAWHMLDAPQGGSQNAVTVAARVKVLGNDIRAAKRGRLAEGLEEWSREIGVSQSKVLLNPKYFSEFHKLVIREIKRPPGSEHFSSSPAVQKAAEGVKAQLRMAGQLQKEAGVLGFENLDIEKNYFPIIPLEGNISSAIPRNGEQKVRDLLSLGYQRGHFKLDKGVADLVADSYIARVKRHKLSMSDYVRTAASEKDLQAVAEGLRKAGVPEETIDDFLNTSLEDELKQHISDRAKKSLYPDISVELNGLRFIDLIDTDIPKLLESYTREAVGNVSFAKLGFKNYHHVMETLENFKARALKNGMDEVATNREFQTLQDCVNLAYGRSLNTDGHKPLVQWLSRLRGITSLVRLQMNGLANIPETARTTAHRGLNVVLRNCKDIGVLGTKSLREGGKYSGHFKRPDLEEMDQIFHYMGEDHIIYDQGIRYDNFEDSEFGGRVGAAVDRLIAQGQRIGEITSAFRMVQGVSERISGRSLAYQIKEWAYGASPSIKGLGEAEIKRAGWYEDKFLDQLKDWLQEHPKYETYEGKPIKTFNYGEMPLDMRERLKVGFHRIVAAEIQRPLLGETPLYMHRWLGQTLTQFRGFSILSLEKQLIHDIRGDKIAGLITGLHAIALSYMALCIQTMHNAIGRKDKDEYIHKQLSGTNLAVGIFNRMGQLAAAGIVEDLLATFGLLPTELAASQAHPGGRVLGGSSVPAFGLVGDTASAIRKTADYAFGRETDVFGDARKKAEFKDVVHAWHKVAPWAKTIGFNQALNTLED